MIFITELTDLNWIEEFSVWNLNLKSTNSSDEWIIRIEKIDVYNKLKYVYGYKWDGLTKPLFIIEVDDKYYPIKGILVTPLEIEGVDLEELLDSV